MSLRRSTNSRMVNSKHILPKELYAQARWNEDSAQAWKQKAVQLLLPQSTDNWLGQQIIYANVLGLKSDQPLRILCDGIPYRVKSFITRLTNS